VQDLLPRERLNGLRGLEGAGFEVSDCGTDTEFIWEAKKVSHGGDLVRVSDGAEAGDGFFEVEVVSLGIRSESDLVAIGAGKEFDLGLGVEGAVARDAREKREGVAEKGRRLIVGHRFSSMAK
jgi:hypothetical protein